MEKRKSTNIWARLKQSNCWMRWCRTSTSITQVAIYASYSWQRARVSERLWRWRMIRWTSRKTRSRSINHGIIRALTALSQQRTRRIERSAWMQRRWRSLSRIMTKWRRHRSRVALTIRIVLSLSAWTEIRSRWMLWISAYVMHAPGPASRPSPVTVWGIRMHPSSCCIISICITCRSALATSRRSRLHPSMHMFWRRRRKKATNAQRRSRRLFTRMQNKMQDTMQNQCKKNIFSYLFIFTLKIKKETNKAIHKESWFPRYRLILYWYVSRGLIIALIHQSFCIFNTKTVQKHSFFLIHLYTFIFFLL